MTQATGFVEGLVGIGQIESLVNQVSNQLPGCRLVSPVFEYLVRRFAPNVASGALLKPRTKRSLWALADAKPRSSLHSSRMASGQLRESLSSAGILSLFRRVRANDVLPSSSGEISDGE